MLDLICEACSMKISPKYWESFVSHVRQKKSSEKTDHIVDNEIEPVMTKYYSSSESNSNSDVEQY